jgi:hypothetical protein
VIRPLALLLLAGCSAAPAAAVPLTPEEERILRPLVDPPDRVRRLVEDGDRLFIKGIAPFRGPEPDTALAMECYTKARTSYLTAQGLYGSPSPVPPPLLDRVNETVARLAVLIKRQRSSR